MAAILDVCGRNRDGQGIGQGVPNSRFLGGDESDLHRISSAPILLYIDI